MQLNEYQGHALETAVYPIDVKIAYPILGLAGEAGEIANKYKKVLRKDFPDSLEMREDLSAELGDVLWYVAVLAYDLGYTLEEVAEINVRKLHSRQERGVIKGDGDTR